LQAHGSSCICPIIHNSTIRCRGSTRHLIIAKLPNTAAVIVIVLIRCWRPRITLLMPRNPPHAFPRRLGLLEALDISSAVDRTNGLATCMSSAHPIILADHLDYCGPYPGARDFHTIGPPNRTMTLHGLEISLNLQPYPLRLTHFKARHER
jgi:hypothetical protein